jgi:isoamylase
VKLVAEPWDAGGLYQVGSFIGDRWMEWNGKFRDDIRSFLKGDKASASSFASRLLGSPDVYGHEGREAEQSINFVACHDGFTLNDLVSYNQKHNEINGERNRDGTDHNLSWNCGVEGPTDNKEIEFLRNRQVKNFLTATFIALGTPMVLMGDEIRRTQLGNNNPYCQDNELTWMDWDLGERHADIRRFLKLLIAARLGRYPIAIAELSLKEALQRAQVQWHGVELSRPDFSDYSHSVALTGFSIGGRFALHIVFNAYWRPLWFEIPTLDTNSWSPWERWIDTALESPEDIKEPGTRPRLHLLRYRVEQRSAVVLVGPARGFAEAEGRPGEWIKQGLGG